MSAQETPAPAAPRNWIADILLWLVVGLTALNFPRPPALELDASWRMSLGYFFTQGLQWGPDVIFTYGPLGFVMGNTYWGQLFWEMIAWQALQAFGVAALFVAENRRLRGLDRVFFVLFVLLFALFYEDALHMIAIALLGLRLVRHAGEEAAARPHYWASVALGFLGVVKFTNLMAGAFAVLVAAGLALHRRTPRAALLNLLCFGGTFLALWLLAGQSPLNLPLFLRDSLQISGGYNSTMGLPTPEAPLRSGLIVAGLLAAYLTLHVATAARRSVALASALVVAAFLFLNWKHGFLRADGHMIGFFICALLPATGFPGLLGDTGPLLWLRRAFLVVAAVLAVVGIEQALPGCVRGSANQLEDRLWTRTAALLRWSAFRQDYRDQMTALRKAHELPEIQKVVGGDTLDVLGHDQGVALFNKFNYHPRPVFQGYSVYTPRLAEKNLEFYASPSAPRFVLVRIHTLDGRLAAMDDARLLNYFLHAYDYVMAEKGWQLWRRRDDAPPAEAAAPRRLRSPQLRVGEALDLADLADRPLWVTIDLRPTLLGRARDLLYKSPILRLVVTDSAGKTTRFRLPPDQGRTGFMLSPLVENENDLIQFAGGTPARRVAKLTLEVDGGPGPFFHDTAAVGLFALPPSEAGRRALAVMERAKYSVFGSMPLSVDAFAPPNRIKIDGVETIMLHAPAALEFAVPPGATIMVGRIGFAPNAYTGDNRTGGAEYRIVWTDRTTEHVLYRRYLDPRNNPDDRGLVSFEANVAQVPTGRVRLVIAPGADNGWDWTACTGIEFR